MIQKNWMTGVTLAVVMLLAMGGTAQAQVTGIDVPYALQCVQDLDGKITITEYNGALTDIAIPGIINGLPVAHIRAGAFTGKGLISVMIPASVTSIGIYAFDANRLISITIGANVELYNYGSSSFTYGFDSAYNEGGKQAGTYTRPNTNSDTWTKQ